jgi:uncharacterized protein YqkB
MFIVIYITSFDDCYLFHRTEADYNNFLKLLFFKSDKFVQNDNIHIIKTQY